MTMIDQPTEKRNHSEQALHYIDRYYSAPVTDLGLQREMEPSDGTLSAEVFRLEVLGKPGQFASNHRQLAVLYLEGTAGASYPNGPIYHDDLPEPIPVAIVEICNYVALTDIKDVAALYDAVEQAVTKLGDHELEQARKVIDRLTGRG
jgi:hypothetical protein